MIKAKIRNRLAQEIEDYLGGDPVERGERRVGVYPGVEVVYYDPNTGKEYGSASYFLRPRSAFEVMDDVKTYVRKEIARLEAERTTSKQPIAQPFQASTKDVSVRIPNQMRDFDNLIGKDIESA
mgnify:CR=1 FL=1